MIKYENDCVDCGFPCLGDSCKHKNVPHYYCDSCGDEETLYYWEGGQYCEECILAIVRESLVEVG